MDPNRNDIKMSRKDFLALPRRKWDEVKEYTDIYIVPDYDLHESGFRLMAIVGQNKEEPMEIAAYCDAIQWINKTNGGEYDWLHSDMLPQTNILHFWSREVNYRVGWSLSSTEITIVNRHKTNK